MTATAEAPAIEGVDPITFEIVRHRLWAVDDGMAMTLNKTAGNPSITDAHDFMVAIFIANGDIVLGGSA
jgi:N-methylhydantoinase B